jgi:hypothetical protein
MTEKGTGELDAAAAKKDGRTWIVRDSRGRRILGMAQTLHAAIKRADKCGEQFPVLEQLDGSDDDSPGPVVWRRTL